VFKIVKISLFFTILILCTVSAKIAFSQIRANGNFINTAPPGSVQDTVKNRPNDTTVAYTKPSFTIKRYFKALAHKDSMYISPMFFGSLALPGTSQIYNHQYWKLPVVYGGLAGFIGGAVMSNIKYQQTGKSSYKEMRSIMIAGAAATYYWSLLDGVISYKSRTNPLPARASFYSALLPGLGQAYNGDYWKIPIFYGGFAISGFCWSVNQKQFKRYKNMYIDAVALGDKYKGDLSLDDMIWYRDSYRRLRDYSIICTALIYVLNIIDANVFAHFSDFDISDDISMKIEPGIIDRLTPDTKSYGGYSGNYYSQTIGLKVNFKF
jgi:hypothetical protein